jgi:hypothetical protein
MKGPFFAFFIFSSVCFLFIITITSCNTIKQSSYAKDNIIKTQFFIHYFNNKAKLSIRFFGGHRPINPPLINYKKHTPQVLKKFLKKDFRHAAKYRMLFYSYSPGKVFGFYYIGLLHKHLSIDSSYKKKTSINNSTFFEKTGVEKIDSFLLKKYIVPLREKDLIFYCFKKILYSFKGDSSVLESDTHHELMTLKSLSNYIPYNKTNKDFLDSITLAADLSGYGAPLNALIKLKRENKDKLYSDILNQYLFSAYAAFDEVDSVKQLLYEQHTFKGNNIKKRSTDSISVDNHFAIPKILKEADSQKVIMINESHYDWRHRYFVTLLLDSLYKKGFKYLCMEALDNEDSINKRKFPTSDDGYYIKEPFMANLARLALKIGYKLIAYEDTTGNLEENLFNSEVDKREFYQASNLYSQYKKDTAAKWLVYAGYSHINKLNFSESEPSSMAKYFYQFSHLNPYSINQTTYCDIFSSKVAFDSFSNRENYYYLRNDQINDSILLKQSDLYIINNIHTISYENLDTSKGLQQYHIHYDRKKNDSTKYFIEVFVQKEYFKNQKAVPVYIKRSSENHFDKNLWLPKNDYYLIITDKYDRIIYRRDL